MLREEAYFVNEDSPIIKDFRLDGYPFCVLTDSSGLVAWSGHPDARDINEDIYDLLNERMIFDTKDKEEDPELPFKDPFDHDVYTEEDEKKQKERNIEDEREKVDHFFEVTEQMCEIMSKEAPFKNDLSKALFVLTSTLTFDLKNNDDPKKIYPKSALTLHRILFGPKDKIEKAKKGRVEKTEYNNNLSEKDKHCRLYEKDPETLKEETLRVKVRNDQGDKTLDEKDEDIYRPHKGKKDGSDCGRLVYKRICWKCLSCL